MQSFVSVITHLFLYFQQMCLPMIIPCGIFIDFFFGAAVASWFLKLQKYITVNNLNILFDCKIDDQ